MLKQSRFQWRDGEELIAVDVILDKRQAIEVLRAETDAPPKLKAIYRNVIIPLLATDQAQIFYDSEGELKIRLK